MYKAELKAGGQHFETVLHQVRFDAKKSNDYELWAEEDLV